MNKLNINKLCASALIALIFSGCSMQGGEVSKEDRNKEMVCTDTRDGETFYFNTNNVSNIRSGFGGVTSFDVKLNNGRSMTLAGDMQSYIKCTDHIVEDK